MKDYEKLGTFYVGKRYDLATRTRHDDLILYDSKDLTTHAVIIGMTGSGKTGLGIGIIEEALIDNIPVIAIDPKGDLPNLLLTFPGLNAGDFRPWVNEQEALKKGLTADQFAAEQAKLWRKGLAGWDQEPERISRLKSAADFAVYTPGSSAGLPVNILRSFSPPPAAIQEDPDLFNERIQTTTTGLLSLLAIEADPITSREHILISNIIKSMWDNRKGLDLAGLIRSIQTPPFERIGIMDLESFYPSKDRFTLAMRLNNLLATPGFEAWLEGEPLDVGRLLHTPTGKPRASIFTISHLSDHERMFFVSMLLNEIVGWMRIQSGTTSLRAILYMDEIFGYFPPVQNPPSKTPLLTLLKQARAFGLGVVLSTQNPVDLDYKGLSNTGTWFIGRLQTERDKERVLAGLEGAAAGVGFDRGQMEEILAGLGQRIFLLHNVHETEPVIFETRWVLSYLPGPMSREQIKQLVTDRKIDVTGADAVSVTPISAGGVTESPASAGVISTAPPMIPPGIETYYLPASGAGQETIYYPAVIGYLDIHYASSKYLVDTVKTATIVAELSEGPVAVDWDHAVEVNVEPADFVSTPMPGAEFAELPPVAQRAGAYGKWNKDLVRWASQNRSLTLYRSRRFNVTSQMNESEGNFRARLAQSVREQRDLEVERLRKTYGSKFMTLKNRLMTAEQAIAREQEQSKSKKIETVISFGTAILGAFLGRKAVSATSASRMGTAMKSASRMGKESMDVERAREKAQVIQNQLEDMEMRLQEDIAALEAGFDATREELEEVRIYPKRTGMTIHVFGLVWMPYRKTAGGQLSPDWVER
ncbi:MAG: ATP-binding protein [Deltaproteobacteria bacterium]|nr:ATP-binding protein [Deltaproteobacteria bacterium]